MKLPWFKRTGLLFSASSIAGWLILLAGVASAIYSFIQIDSHSHAVSETLMNFAFRLLLIVASYLMLAYISSHTHD